MTASQHIKTPAMTLPLKPTLSRLHANIVARRLDTLRLSDLIAWHRPHGGIRVSEKFCPQSGAVGFGALWDRMYRIRIYLSDQGAIQRTFQLSFRRVAAAVGRRFTACLLATIASDVRRSGGAQHARKFAGTDGGEADEAGGAGNSVGVAALTAPTPQRAGRKAAKSAAKPPPVPDAGDDSDEGDVGSDSDAEEVAGASGGHKSKVRVC